MSGWILSIVGMVLTVTLTEIMLPEGQTAKYVKGVISLMIVYVVLAPIPSLLQSKIDINSFFDLSVSGYESDESFIECIKADKQSSLAASLDAVFVKSGLSDSSVIVVLEQDGTIGGVILTTSERESDAAYRLTLDYLCVKEEQIVVNEILT